MLIANPMTNSTMIAARVCVSVLMSAAPAAAATIAVAAGGNLQAAIDSASPGDTIALAPGATFTGSFTLPNKGGADFITIRTAGDSGLPGAGTRVSPANAGSLAKIRQGGSGSDGLPGRNDGDGRCGWKRGRTPIPARRRKPAPGWGCNQHRRRHLAGDSV